MAIAVIVSGSRTLVGRRSRAPLAGTAEFPGGRVRLGETPAQAAARETWEETGLRVAVERLLTRRRHAYPHALVDLWFFLCTPEVAIRRTPRQPFRWVDLATLPTLRFPPANQPVLSLLAAQSRGEWPGD